MTEKRTYPREWFLTTSYLGGVESRMFDHETEKTLVYTTPNGRIVRRQKKTTYYTWHPTREEAEAELTNIMEREDAAHAARCARAAAPELLEGAMDAVKAFKLLRAGMIDDAAALEVIDAHVDELEYAIAKARGDLA